MRLRYEQLFNIALTTSYYTDNETHDDLSIEPTRRCEKLLGRYKILSRKTFNGITLLYECSPLTNDATAFRPIVTEEKFAFKVKVNNPDFWFYADVKDWESGKVYLLKNPIFNSTGNITILSGALTSPILYRPMEFKYEVTLETVEGLLEVRNSNGTLIKTLIIRAKSATEPPVVKEQYLIDLKNYPDDTYSLDLVSTAVTPDEKVYCSVDYSPDTLAILEITYKGDAAWTGVQPSQNYIVSIESRKTFWFLDVHIRKKAAPILVASDLSINHLPVAGPARNFGIVGAADDINGFIQFKSNQKLSYSQTPMHLQLLKLPATIVLDPLPLPSPDTLRKDSLNNLFTQIIVNI